jgi:hypothetical protein
VQWFKPIIPTYLRGCQEDPGERFKASGVEVGVCLGGGVGGGGGSL